MGYLVPVDGDPEKLFVTSIPMNSLYDIAQMSYAKHILYLVDACYGGLALAATRGLKKSVPNYLSKITREKGRQIITAGSAEQVSWESGKIQHGIFTLNVFYRFIFCFKFTKTTINLFPYRIFFGKNI